MNRGKLLAKLYFVNPRLIESIQGNGNGVRRKKSGENLDKIRQALTCKYCGRVFRKSFGRIRHVRELHATEFKKESQKINSSKFKREVCDDEADDLVSDVDDDYFSTASSDEDFPEAVEVDRETWEMLARLPEFNPKLELRDVYKFEETALALPPKPGQEDYHNEDCSDLLEEDEDLPDQVKKEPPDWNRERNDPLDDSVILIDDSDDESKEEDFTQKLDGNFNRLIKREPMQEPSVPGSSRLSSREGVIDLLEISDDESELLPVGGSRVADSPNALQSGDHNAIFDRPIKQEFCNNPPAVRNRMLSEEVFFVIDSSDEEMECEVDSEDSGRPAAASVRRFATTPTPRV